MPLEYIGASNLIATNGGAPGAITAHANTLENDLLICFHYSRATGGNETVAAPVGGGWTQIFNSVTANNGLVAVFWKIRSALDTTYTFTITNHTTGNSGETVLQHIETWRGYDAATPIGSFTAALSTWASSLNLGAISAPSSTTLSPGSAVVVFGGRFENITAQTTLTGDNLTWSQSVQNNTNLGSDAGAVTQKGFNNTGSNQTITSKTITTTGTAQAGAGRMFIINVEPTQNLTLTITQGSITTTGQSITLKRDNKLSITNGNINVTGESITLRLQKKLFVVDTNIDIVGSSIDIYSDRKLIITDNSIIVNGESINLKLDRKLTIDNGNITVNGSSISLLPSWITARRRIIII
jgi:ribosome-associated protein YbcJ (S4-like RNA binding protein)